MTLDLGARIRPFFVADLRNSQLLRVRAIFASKGQILITDLFGPDLLRGSLVEGDGRTVQTVGWRVGQGVGHGHAPRWAAGMAVRVGSRLKAQSGRRCVAAAVTLGGRTITVAMRAGIRLSCGGCLHWLGVAGMAGHLGRCRRCGIGAGNHHGYAGGVRQQGGNHQQQRKQQPGGCPTAVSTFCCC